MTQPRILILEDEQAIGEMVEIILKKEGFTEVDLYGSCKEVKTVLPTHAYDLYILDIMLPDGSGLELAQQIRRWSDAPIFFLTAKTSDADKLRGFMHGADDYITKPFNPLELAARVKVQTRRYVSRETTSSLYDFGEFQFDVQGAELSVRGSSVPISGKLFYLLKLFCEHPDQILTKEQVYEAVWGLDSFIDDNTIMVHMRRLREKIETEPSRPRYLLTVRGIGYKLQTERK